ncbi:MAG: pilus assembly protein PilP [Steroidobacteraceae bacterium]
MNRVIPLLLVAAAVSVAGCSSKDSELDRFIAQTKQEPPGRVELLPEVKPYDTFPYTAQDMRSPFVPGGAGGAGSLAVRPNTKRSREYLEEFPLDSLKMVGTLSMSGRTYGLVQTKENKVQRVLPGNYLGQNDGRILSIAPSKITVSEIVPDGSGGFIERGAALALNE